MSATVSRSQARNGHRVILRRLPATDVTCLAVIRDFSAGALPGGLPGGNPQGFSVMRISNDEIAAASWPGPPRKGDRVIADGRICVVESCETRRKGEVVARHILKLSGG